jgi:hypothetical protein
MGYAHIENLYRPKAQRILQFKRCFALEKIHGTSAHIRWSDGALHFFSGGETHDKFVALFDQAALVAAFTEHRVERCVVHGEAYGGKQQGMAKVYGPKLRFVAFDVHVGDKWLDVPAAAAFVTGTLKLEFVHYVDTSTDVAALDALRDGLSQQSLRNGQADGAMYDSSKAEGVVLRPPFEVTLNSGERLCAKHKRAEFCERKTPVEVDPGKLAVLEAAEAIADEWVTEMRLSHVLDKLGNPTDMSATGDVIRGMVEDVLREASGEIVDSKDARKAIGARAAKLFKARVSKIREDA